MKKAVVYIHGKGGSAEEYKHYIPFFKNAGVMGFDYKAQNPWEAKHEFGAWFDELYTKYSDIYVIANSIGAYFTMMSLSTYPIKTAWFISPVVDMLQLIKNMMLWAGVTEEELCSQREIVTSFGETLSWDYFCYAKDNVIKWPVPTEILYGENDTLTARETVTRFAKNINAGLTIMKNGEHWFHTEEQMRFIDGWLSKTVHS